MDHPLSSSLALIRASQQEGYPSNNPWRDKAFITAVPSVCLTSGIVVTPEEYLSSDAKASVVYLDVDHAPVAMLHNDLADNLIPELQFPLQSVPRIRSGQTQLPQWLISCGTLLSDPNGILILFERTETDPSGKLIAWPRAFNNPMGRCDGIPSAVCLKEGAQEVSILERLTASFNDQNVSYTPRLFQLEGKTGITEAEELDLQEAMTAHLARTGQPLDGSIGPTERIPVRKDDQYDHMTVPVVTRARGKVIDEFHAVAAFSKAERTLELAMPLCLEHSNPDGLVYYAREPFGRKTVRLSPDQLQAAFYGWVMGAFGTRQDPQQNRVVHLGGILPILQVATGMRAGVSRPEEVTVPPEWPLERVQHVMGNHP